MKSTKEMISTVQIYIHHRKGVEVDIAIPNTKERMRLLVLAYAVAKNWLGENLVQ